MEVIVKKIINRQAILETKNQQQIIIPTDLLPKELTIGDACYFHIDIPQDLEHQKIRKLNSLLEELIN